MGTRLRSAIGEHQKCAVDVAGRPWIHRVLDFLAGGGIEHAVLLTGYKSHEMEKAARGWAGEVGISCLDSEPSGPAEAISLAFRSTKAKLLLVVNGDTLIEGFDLRGFLAAQEGTICRTVRGPSVLSREVVESGIYVRFRGCGTPGSVVRTDLPFLDIGTPEGLAEARRRFSA